MASGGGEVNLSLPFDPSEDFEVVTDNPSDVGIMENLSGEMDGVLDPSETFEMIQEEHSAAKRALENQRSLLLSQIDILQTAKDCQRKQVDELASKVTQLELTLEERDQKILSLETDVKNYKETSMKADELTAKLCHAEETNKYLEGLIKSSNEGFVMVSPGVHDLGTDKDKELSDLKKLVDRMQAELFDLDELKKERDELKNLTIALENQNQCDNELMYEMKAGFNEEKKALMEELERLKQGSSAQQSGDILILQNAESSQLQCHQCYYQAPNQAELDRHTFHCPQNSMGFD